jgi:hypothetical protein
VPKTQNLKFDMWGGPPNKHVQTTMEELGITYVEAIPQSMGDCWWFYGCQNVPDPRPDYLSPLDTLPQDCIGFGLSAEGAAEVTRLIAEIENA